VISFPAGKETGPNSTGPSPGNRPVSIAYPWSRPVVS